MAQPLVPTQLISAAFLVGAGAILLHPAFKRLNAGVTFALSAIAYSLFRFTIEFWRDDPRVFVGALSDGQIFSIAYLMLGIGMFLFSRRSHVEKTAR
jgi:phosphatidylglycerol:prolipoprotein diacylglycerol transferase